MTMQYVLKRRPCRMKSNASVQADQSFLFNALKLQLVPIHLKSYYKAGPSCLL